MRSRSSLSRPCIPNEGTRLRLKLCLSRTSDDQRSEQQYECTVRGKQPGVEVRFTFQRGRIFYYTSDEWKRSQRNYHPSIQSMANPQPKGHQIIRSKHVRSQSAIRAMSGYTVRRTRTHQAMSDALAWSRSAIHSTVKILLHGVLREDARNEEKSQMRKSQKFPARPKPNRSGQVVVFN